MCSVGDQSCEEISAIGYVDRPPNPHKCSSARSRSFTRSLQTQNADPGRAGRWEALATAALGVSLDVGRTECGQEFRSLGANLLGDAGSGPRLVLELAGGLPPGNSGAVPSRIKTSETETIFWRQTQGVCTESGSAILFS